MSTTPYTAVIRRDGRWWIGWVEEVPGVNSQGETREELLSNLREALNEAIEMNREDARKAAGEQFEERGFATAVAADKADLRILGQGDGGLVEEPAAPGVENEVFDLQHRSSNWARTSARRICGWDGWAKNLAPRQRLTGRLHSRPTRARHAEGLEVWPWAP